MSTLENTNSESPIKKGAWLALVLVVGLLAATGVGPRTVTHAARALTTAKPTQDAAYAIATFLDRLVPASSSDAQQGLQSGEMDPGSFRLASSHTPESAALSPDARNLVKPGTPVPDDQMQDSETFEIITIPQALPAPAPSTITDQSNLDLSIDALFKNANQRIVFEQNTIALSSDSASDSLNGAVPLFVPSPIPVRIITTMAHAEGSHLPTTVLRWVGVTSPMQMTRRPFALEKEAQRKLRMFNLSSCDDAS
jgi:hypothetical protein